jgi:hypothetical protein
VTETSLSGGVWVLHLQQALNRPSHHHSFSRAFGSFHAMNPTEQTPQNNHDGHSKRRRLDGPSPGDTPAINRYVSTFNRSPAAASIPNQSAENRPQEDDDDDSFIDRPITQDPSLLLPSPPPPPPSNVVAAIQAAAAVVGLGPTFVSAPDELTPLEDIPSDEVEIINQVISDFYGINEPRDFQVQAIHYLAFHDNPSLVLLCRTADGKSLVPLTTSILRCGITLVLVPLHGLGSDQVDKATVLDRGVEAYYIDEHKAQNANTLKNRLMAYSHQEEAESSTICCSSMVDMKSGYLFV